MTEPVRLAFIIASTRAGRFGPTVADWVTPLIAGRTDVELDIVDLAEADLPAHFTTDLAPETQAMAERLERADAFVVLTPEYNHSYPASLKQAIDITGTVWARKPVAFVAYGGLSGGLRAVEHLRTVFAEVRATTIREAVSFHGFPFDEAGTPHDLDNATKAVEIMVDDLVWWADALRAARSRGD